MKTCCASSASSLVLRRSRPGLACCSVDRRDCFFFLLVSAANTAIVAMIGLLFMMAQDGEMPRQFTKLNKHGVPIFPLLIVVGMPTLVLLTTQRLHFAGRALRDRRGRRDYGQCRVVHIQSNGRPHLVCPGLLLGSLFVILAFVEVTLAHTKPDALFFVICVLSSGLLCAPIPSNSRD